MKQKVTLSLDSEILAFVDSQARGNRSEYIGSVLVQQRQAQLRTEMIAALQQDQADAEYRQSVAAWDSVAGDGIDA